MYSLLPIAPAASEAPGEMDPLLVGVVLLTILSVACLIKVDRSWMHREGGFPWRRAVGLMSGLVATALPFIAGWTPQATVLPGIVTLLHLLFLLIPRVSGYRPATATLALSHWGTARRDEVIALLNEHLVLCRLHPIDPEGWRWDVVARGKVHGTVTESTGVPHMAFARIEPGAQGLKITLMVECVDLVINDTGESENCRQLLLAIAKRFAEPPFREEGQPLPEINLPSMF